MDRSGKARFRAFDASHDVPALVALYAEMDEADGTAHGVDEAKVRSHLGLWGHDPAIDRWVAADPVRPDSLAGHTAAYRDPEDSSAWMQVAVSPLARRSGLGSALLERALARAAAWDSPAAIAYSRSAGGRAFLAARGFVLDHSWRRMVLPAGTPAPATVPAASVPAGLRFDPWDGDAAAFARIMTEAYEGQPGHAPVSVDAVAEWMKGWKLPDTLLAYAADGTLAGICRTEDREAPDGTRTGWIDAPGLLPPYRSPGALAAFLTEAASRLRSGGCGLLELESWGDPEEALALYRSLGFGEAERLDTFRRPLARADAVTAPK